MGLDWTGALAVALVTRTHLSDKVVAGLEEAFLLGAEVSELRLVLANGGKGEANTLESFALISQGAVCRAPRSVVAVLPREPTTACVQSMQRCEVVLITDQSPEREQLVDWVRLSELTPGLRWMMSCPLTCKFSVMGSTLVAGCSASPSLDADWLQSWSCEMAHTIAHCSVQVMEASLDMLQRIFPGDMLKTLILKACSPNGQITPDMAERLAHVLELGVIPTADEFVALTTGTGANSSAEGLFEAPMLSAAAVGGLDPAGYAPSAASSGRSSIRSSGGESAQSRASSHASAVVLLRQVSQVTIRTEISFLISEDPSSPYSEEEGFEDLLEESAQEHAHAQHWASSSMEGARSRRLPNPLRTAKAVEGLQVPPDGTPEDHGGVGGAGDARVARLPSLSVQAAAYPASSFDLAFKNVRLEKAFECSTRAAMLRCDRMVGCTQALLPVIVLLGCIASSGSLSVGGAFFLLGAALLVLPTAASFLRTMWWLRSNHRQHVVASMRIAFMAGYAWFVILQPGSNDGSTAQRILVQSGLAALLMGPIRYPLLLSAHLPVQLACLWIATAAHASLHHRQLSALGVPSALVLQLCGGMLLPSAVVYYLECRQRQEFLNRRAAARSAGGLKFKTT